MREKPLHTRIPKSAEVFGRVINTIFDENYLTESSHLGEARYGENNIALRKMVRGKNITEDEIKVTYLHEMLHFILNFTGFQQQIIEGKSFDLEQFVESVAAGIYQYEKTAKY